MSTINTEELLAKVQASLEKAEQRAQQHSEQMVELISAMEKMAGRIKDLERVLKEQKKQLKAKI